MKKLTYPEDNHYYLRCLKHINFERTRCKGRTTAHKISGIILHTCTNKKNKHAVIWEDSGENI